MIQTIEDLKALKNMGLKFPVLSCYDYTTADIAHRAGIEVLLVGDSASQYLLGHRDTLAVSMDFMVEITSAVVRASKGSVVIADIPFSACQNGVEELVKNCVRFVVEAGADIVKIEMGNLYPDDIKDVIKTGIPVMPHIGICPQTGIFRAKGTDFESATEIFDLAIDFEAAGACGILLEGTSTELGRAVTQAVKIPVIGCGSGVFCDGNVLVSPDVLGILAGKIPKFSKAFGSITQEMKSAFSSYAKAVSQGCFPDDQHSYHMKREDLDKFQKYISDKLNM